VGSESDCRLQIKNFGTTAERGSCSYALCSRDTGSQSSARIDVLYTQSKFISCKARSRVQRRTLLSILKCNSYSNRERNNKETA
jgi:hypothetical protein